MPRKARDEKLDTRTARLRLAVRREPYWRTIQEGRAIGYRRIAGGKAGTWIARHYDAATGRQHHSLGNADDLMDADGADTLTFAQAQEAAADWFDEVARASGKVETPQTVRDAVKTYLTAYQARGGKQHDQVNEMFNAHILPKLGDVLIKDLTPRTIRSWHQTIATTPPRLRTAANAKKQNVRVIDATDPDASRARRATANRIMTALKAALNHAFRDGRIASDAAWRRVQPFANVEAARIRYLTDDEAVRLVNACPPDLRNVVIAALLTGCRYGELIALKREDIDLAAQVLTVRQSKSGKPRHVTLTDEAIRFFDGLSHGKARAAILLTREDGEAWGENHQFRPLRAACEAAKIAPAISFHILRHTHASRLAMKGVHLAVVAAQLGHADTRVTERHYAHLSPSHVAAEVRAAFGDLGLVPKTNVKPMRKKAKG